MPCVALGSATKFLLNIARAPQPAIILQDVSTGVSF